MTGYYLHVNESKVCRDIEIQLQQRGVNFIRIQHEPCGEVLPALVGPDGVFEGTANIQLYFLFRKRSMTGAGPKTAGHTEQPT